MTCTQIACSMHDLMAYSRYATMLSTKHVKTTGCFDYMSDKAILNLGKGACRSGDDQYLSLLPYLDVFNIIILTFSLLLVCCFDNRY